MNDLEQTICRKRMKKMYQSRNMRISGRRSEKILVRAFSLIVTQISLIVTQISRYQERKNFRFVNIKIFFFKIQSNSKKCKTSL